MGKSDNVTRLMAPTESGGGLAATLMVHHQLQCLVSQVVPVPRSRILMNEGIIAAMGIQRRIPGNYGRNPGTLQSVKRGSVP